MEEMREKADESYLISQKDYDLCLPVIYDTELMKPAWQHCGTHIREACQKRSGSMSREVSWKISYLGFVSTGIVFLHHANLTSYIDNVPASKAMIMNFFTYLVIFAMSWFVFISAYLFFREIKPGDFKRKYKARIYTLLLPYLIWNTLAVCLKLLDGDPLFQTGIFGFFRENYFFFNGHGVADGPLWYVFRLFTYLAFAPIIYLICANDRYLIKTGVLASALIVLNCVIKANYYSFLHFLPTYILGAGIGMNSSNVFERAFEYSGGVQLQQRIRLIVMLIVAAGMCYVGGYLNQYGQVNHGCYIITYACRMLSVLPVISVVSRIKCSAPPSGFVAGSGMFILGSHELIFRVLRRGLQFVNVDVLVEWVLLIVLDFGVIVFAWFFLSRFSPQLLTLLSGGRNKRKS